MAVAIPFQQEVEEFIAMQVGRMPAEILDDLTSPIQMLKDEKAAEKALKEGDMAPDFVLPDAHDRPVSLAELRQKGPVVITFYRGIWCNFCNIELRAYQRLLPEIEAAGGSLIAVSPQTQDHCMTLAEKQSLSFPVLSDIGNKVARQYQLVFRIGERAQSAHHKVQKVLPKFNGDDSWEVPIPATYLVDQTGLIRLSYVDPDFMQRLDPAVVVAKLKEMQAQA